MASLIGFGDCMFVTEMKYLVDITVTKSLRFVTETKMVVVFTETMSMMNVTEMRF